MLQSLEPEEAGWQMVRITGTLALEVRVFSGWRPSAEGCWLDFAILRLSH
jgi:hypothetical protein